MSTTLYALVLVPALLIGFGSLGYARLRMKAGQLDRARERVSDQEQARLFRGASAAE